MFVRAKANVLGQIQLELLVASQSNFKIKVDHVKGHQDEVRTYNELSREAQLNVQADASATNYLINGRHHD